MNISSRRGHQSSSYGSVEGEFLQSRGGRNHERSGGLLRWVGIAAVAGLALGAMMAARSDGSQQDGVKTMNLAELTSGTRATNVDVLRESSQEPLSFTALNFYQERDGKPGQDYPWLKDMKLLEPYRDTTLAVTNPREGFDYQWEIRADGDLITSATGASTVVIVTKLEENVVTLQELNESGNVVRSLQETVMVKYVRREIRTLTEEDKEELLDTMHVLWEERVMGGNGKEKYGDGYCDIWAINRLHFKAATIDSCDHFHDGIGFLVSHSLLSNTFEHSLQVVNPRVTLPYWDFTIEESSSADPTYDPKEPSTRSPLLQPDYFGAYDPDDHIVKSGRWAYTKIPSVLPNNPGSLNTDVYGRLRSPWNTNDRPYLTRGMGEMCQIEFDQDIAWPTCQKHYDLVAGYDNFYEWVWESLGNPHAPIHFWLGGNIDCRNTFKRIADVVGSDTAESLVHLANAHRKELYCDGIWSCEGTADISKTTYELAGDGTCGCHGFDLDWGHDYKFIIEHLDFGEFLLGDFDEKTQRDVIKAICGGVLNYGEHGQSSSPLDPSFWPTHPTMERLWQYSVLTESVTDFNWPDKDITVTLPDGTTISEVTSSYYEQCFGHRGFDVFPFGLLENDIDDFEVWTGVVGTGSGNTLTNREVLGMFDPRENNMQYIYDTFKWKHCDADGVFFDDAWGDTSAVRESVDHRFFERQKPLSAVYINLKRKMADLMEEKADL